ncbi:unnamed protein product [Tilletia controversa]|nr:unnamed protein product [Tilletia controversa]
MQLRPQPPIRFNPQADDDDNEDLSEHDRASPTPSAFSSSSSLSSPPDSNHHMDSPDSSFGGPADSGPTTGQAQRSAPGSSTMSHTGTDSGHTDHSQQGDTSTSSAGPVGGMNLAEIFVFSSDPSSRPRGSLTALVHRGQSHPVSRGMPKKKRNKCTSEQLAALEEFFQTNRNPTGRIREELSKRIRMPERSVQVWFQNKRAKIKTGEPKPDAEILADYAGSTTTSPITQLALAGIAARNKQLQLSSPAPQAPAPPQKTAEALPAFSLTIGSWRRLNPTLVIFFALKLQTFVSYVRSDSLGYKLDIPIQSVTRIGFAGPEAPTQVESEEGLEEVIGRLTIEVNRAPTFFMEVFRSTRDGDANNKPSWRQCSDFTQDRQATKETTHYICGPYAELKKALAQVVHTSETVRSRMSPEDLSRVLGPDPPMPMMPYSTSAAPPMPYLLPEQAQHFMSYPSSSMMNVSMSAQQGHFQPDYSGPSNTHEGASSDTIMPRNSWRFESSMSGGVPPVSAMQQPMSASHGQQSIAAGSGGSMGNSFEWYGGSSSSHSSNSHSQSVPQAHRYGPTSSPSTHMHSQQHQVAPIPLSLHGRSESMSGLQGSPSFSMSYPMGSGSESASMYELHNAGGSGSIRGAGSRPGYYSASASISGPAGTNSGSSSGNLTGSSVTGTPQTSMSSLSGQTSESGRSFTSHFASGFVGLGLEIDMPQSGSNSASHHDARTQSHPAQEQQNSALPGIQQQQQQQQQQSVYAGHSVNGGYSAAQAQHAAPSGHAHHGAGGGFMLPPRLAWSEGSSGAHSHPQHFGSQSQAPGAPWTSSAGGGDAAHPPASISEHRSSADAESKSSHAHGVSVPGRASPSKAADEVQSEGGDAQHATRAESGSWAMPSRSGPALSSSAPAAVDTSTRLSSLPRNLSSDAGTNHEHDGDGGSEAPRYSKNSNASSTGTMMPPYHGDHSGRSDTAMDHDNDDDKYDQSEAS